MNINTVIIPTDFSDNAQNAIRFALAMFGGENPAFVLLNAYRILPAGAEEQHTDITDFESISKQGLIQVSERIKKDFPGRKFTIEVVSKMGYPVEVIDKVVKRKKADLVVMGTKGASGLREILIGSNTADAIKTLSCPLLVVPGNARFKTPASIAFAADFKNIEKEVVLEPMVEIAKKFKSEVLVLHVGFDSQPINVEEAMQGMRLHEYLKGLPHLFQEVRDANPAEGIETFINTHTVELLVLLARKHSFWERFFKTSVTGKLAMHTRVPMLALQYK